MPEPIRTDRRYMPGLDGVRAIAVLAVMAYHLGLSWTPGGLLGVGVFFTLSGYLITDLLLGDATRGGIRLGDFWRARARRLLPGLFAMLVVVTAVVTLIGPHQDSSYRQAVGSAVLYFNNWWLIFHDVSYFEVFAEPAPLNHLWSLSVEEQFYILWPLLVVLGVRLVPASRYGTRLRLAAITFGAAVVSTVVMAVLYEPGVDPSRVYYGTDTRAAELLVGATLAMVWPSRRLQSAVGDGARKTLDAVGVAGLLIILVFFWRSGEFSGFLYRGGFLVLALATAALVAAVVHPASRLAGVLGCRPLRWVGERSYGIYLWHFPVAILSTSQDVRGTSLVTALLQVAATFAIAALSWRYIEDPIRRRRVRLPSRLADWRPWRLPAGERVAVAACVLVFLAAAVGLAGVNVKESSADEPGRINLSQTVTVATDEAAAAPETDRTSCDSVVHIGDSTSEGLVSAEYLPKPKWLISARYAGVGVGEQHLEVSGARSIYERFNGLPNAEDVAESWLAQGFDGCWVLALGTNEAANVAAGSAVSLSRRIRIMMSAIGNQPVLWVNVRSLVKSGPYAAANMKLWDEALEDACATYPNMRIYDWASDVRDEWFIPDGIHFTTPGYRARALYIADALRIAFPDGARPSPDCVVHPPAAEAAAS